MRRQRVKKTGIALGPGAHLVWGMGLLAVVALSLALGCGTRVAVNGGDREFAWSVRSASGDAARVLYNVHYYRLMGRPELALKELEGAYQRDPRNLKLANTLAGLYEELGQMERARQIYREALALDRDNPVLHNNLCFSYYLAGKWQEAEAGFRQTLDRQPANDAARNNLGLLLCRQGRQEEARRLWQAAEGRAEADRKLAQALTALGMAKSTQVAQAAQPAPEKHLAAEPPSPGAGGQADPSGSRAPVQAGPQLGEPKAPKQLAVARPHRAAEDPGTGPQNCIPAAARAAELSKPEKPVVARPRPPPEATKTANPQTKARTPGADPPQPLAAPPQPKSSAPVAAGGKDTPLPRLTAEDLLETNIEVRNGNGAPNLAHETRSLLSLEGFNVVSIANHIDFGMDRTTIYYRAQAEKMARVLRSKFFPGAQVQPAATLAEDIDIKIILGHELPSPGQMMAEGLRKERAM